jgi:MFS family permease
VREGTIGEHPIETRSEADHYAFSLMLFLMMSSIALSLVPIVRDQLQQAPFSFSDSQIGLLASVFMLTFSMGAVPAGVAAYLTAGLGAAQVLGNAGGAMAMARWGKPAVIVGSMALMFLATVLVSVVPGVAAVFACVVVAGFLTMALYPAILGSIIEIVPRSNQVGPATGYMTTVGLLGTMFAPWLFGALLDSYGTGEGTSGYLWGYLLLGLFALVGSGAAIAYMSLRRGEASSETAEAGTAGLASIAGDAGTGVGVRTGAEKAR